MHLACIVHALLSIDVVIVVDHGDKGYLQDGLQI